MSHAANPAAKVQLTLMCLYRLHAEGAAQTVSAFVGSEAVSQQNSSIQITAGSVPFHDKAMDVLAPRQDRALLTLFGIRDALQELQHWRAVARTAQAQFTYLQLQVDVGAMPLGALTRSSLQQAGASLRFVNVKRCAVQLQKEWLQQFAQWVEQEGHDGGQMRILPQMAKRPDLFERLMWEDPDLAHVDVLVIPLADRIGSESTRQVALLRAGARITAITQGSDQAEVQLPQWMGSRLGA